MLFLKSMIPIYLSLILKGEKSIDELQEVYKTGVKDLAESKLHSGEIDQEQYNNIFE